MARLTEGIEGTGISLGADSPNDLWQMDIKGPFRIENQSYYALIGIDDPFKIHHKLLSSQINQNR